MLKFNVLIALLWCISIHDSLAQRYSIFPNDTVTAEVPMNDISHFIIEQKNLTQSKLIFSWQRLAVSVPITWTSYLCDNGHCFSDFPESGTMDTVFPGDYGLISVAVDPADFLGKAFVQYAVWEKLTPEVIDTLTWILETKSAANVSNTKPVEPLFQIYKNKARIGQLNNLYSNIQIVDLHGKEVLSSPVHSKMEISLPDLTAGMYVVKFSGSKHYFKKIYYSPCD